MNKAFDKILERLEREIAGKHTPEEYNNGINKAFSIVQEAEEEYKKDMKYKLAEMYAKSMVDYGIDVTKVLETATQQSYALEQAYIRGRQYERDRFNEWRKEHNGGWIPCSVRLPDDVCRRYLVTYKEVYYGEYYYFTDISYLSTLSDGNKSWEIEEECKRKKVIAWQLLPEPFKERD